MHKAQLARYASVQHEYTVDFREVAGSYPFRFENAKGQAWKPVEFCPIEQERTIEDSTQRYDDQMVREANNETEITFKNIDVSWLSRKSGKLYRNYAMAAATVTTMRNYLAQLKFGTGKYHSIACVPEANDEKIVLRDAPIIQLTRVRDQEGSLYQGKTIILGVWIKGQGTPADKILESDSHIADVHDPVLTPGQQKAFDAMNDLRSGEFWVRAAHENGIRNDDNVIRSRAESLKNNLDYMLPVKY